MGEILGLGCTHYPGLTVPDERLPASFHRLLTAPGVPDYYKDRANWPAELMAELGNDQGYSAAHATVPGWPTTSARSAPRSTRSIRTLCSSGATTSTKIFARTSFRPFASWASTTISPSNHGRRHGGKRAEPLG